MTVTEPEPPAQVDRAAAIGTDRLSSGQPRLDEILGGGLPTNAITILSGLPGTGKTVLAQQYVFANAAEERPAVYLSTVSEPFEKILRFAQGLSFFDTAAVGRSVFYENLGAVLQLSGLEGVLEELGRLIRERRPGVIVIDSFKALNAYATSREHFRRFLHDTAALLSAFPVSSFWLGEYGPSEISECPEFAVADAIISLTTTQTSDLEVRVLEVLKLRGSAFAPGRHAYRLSGDGLDVFPRLADPGNPGDYHLQGVRQSSGIEALDRMLADGYWPGASILCAGPSGAGKTLLGLHFIFRGAALSEPGVIATMQENPTQLERIVGAFGWTLADDGIELMYRSPVDLYIDQWVYELLDTIERSGARRVLIDSLTDLQFAARDEIRFREFMYSLVQRCSRRGVSVFMTAELSELFRVDRLSEYGISHLADNVVVMHYVRRKSEIERALMVIKTRASTHDPQVRVFRIAPEGIVLGDPVTDGRSD
jgi:circadian clock protein KaiC